MAQQDKPQVYVKEGLPARLVYTAEDRVKAVYDGYKLQETKKASSSSSKNS